MLSFFPKYRVSARTAETLKANEPVRWEAAEDDLRSRMILNGAIMPSGSRKALARFTEDQVQRLVALAVLTELGVYKRTFPEARSEPVEALVGEPVEPSDD